MASLTQPARSRTAPATALLVLLALLTALAGLPGVAAAEPRPTVADARRELARLDREVDAAVEDYDEARLALAGVVRRAAAGRARVARAEAQLAALQRQIGSVAAAVYRSGGVDEFVTLVMTSNPQTFVDQATTLDHIARSQATQLRAVRSAHRRLRAEQVAARQALARQQAVERRLATVRRDVERKVTRQQALLDRLEDAAARQARLDRQARLARLAAAAAQARPARASRAQARTYSGPASGRAAIAVREAHRQLGKPYRWGAAGPDAFDCSGLTMWVWAKAGVALPHSSRAQYGHGRRVSRSELQPGDLVFFGSPIHHVGIYVGGGRYIAAPRTGDVVSFRGVDRYDYTGAVRL